MIVLAVLAAAVALLSLAAFFGGTVWWLDVIANFRAQFVVLLAVLGLILSVTNRRRWGYGVLAAAAVNLVVVLPLFVGAPADVDPGSPTLRVMSFNLLSTNESYQEVIDYIERLDPDVVLLHEASRPWEVAMDTGPNEYEVVRARSDDLIFGTLVLAKGSEIEAVSYGFSTSSPRAVSVEMVPEGWAAPVTVLGTHPLAPTDAERASLRDAQIEFVGEWASSTEGHVVVAGDFNATPWSWPFRSLLVDTDLENSQVGYGLQPSFPAPSNLLLRVPIDHLLHSDSLKAVDRRLGPALGSDHFPLVVDLQPAG